MGEPGLGRHQEPPLPLVAEDDLALDLSRKACREPERLAAGRGAVERAPPGQRARIERQAKLLARLAQHAGLGALRPLAPAPGHVPPAGIGDRRDVVAQECEQAAPDQQHDLRTIEVQSAKLLEMVNQMLTLQKLETGKVIYEPIKDDIIAFINHLSEPFEFQAKSKGLDFYIHHEYAECNMDFDPGKLEMVLVNLISNAIKFTNKGRITLHTELTDDNQLDIRISDTGIGIHQDQIAHIFSRFYQADQSTTRFGEGTGIGLSLVKDLVPIIHGTIEVKSELAQGTEFLLRLTISRKAARQSLQLSNTGKIPENGIPVNVPAAKKPVKPKATILFIEDHKDVRHYLRAVFSDEYHVLEAHHGDQGVLMARQNIPDLIVSDIMMPQKDGYDVCQAIHDDPLTSHIPIILLTAKADVQSKIIGYEKGADAYLEKPFHPKELDAQINMLLVQRKRLQLKYQESPSGEPSLQQISREDPFLTELCTLLYEHIAEDDFGIKEICIQMLVSRSQLHNKVKGVTGLSTSLFIRKLRLEEARKLIYSTDLSVAEIAYQVGFKDPNFFSRVYRKEFGKSPGEGRR